MEGCRQAWQGARQQEGREQGKKGGRGREGGVGIRARVLFVFRTLWDKARATGAEVPSARQSVGILSPHHDLGSRLGTAPIQ